MVLINCALTYKKRFEEMSHLNCSLKKGHSVIIDIGIQIQNSNIRSTRDGNICAHTRMHPRMTLCRRTHTWLSTAIYRQQTGSTQTHSHTHTHTHTHSLTHSLTHYTHTHSLTHSITHLCTHSLTHSLTHTHSLTLPLTLTLTHPPIHQLTH